MHELLLVSQSPRRKQLLEDEGFLFRVDTVKISEKIEENVNLGQAISDLARTKAEAYLDEHKHLKGREILVLSADTMVVHDGRPLGKPKNSTEAQEFLRLLSGQTHLVITGIFLWDLKSGKKVQDSDSTEVEFRTLNEQEIHSYIETGEPMDKAGAYAIQGLGGKFVVKIRGSHSNVVGLPMELFKKTLEKNDWLVAKK